MRPCWLLTLLLFPAAGLAKPWNTIEPGSSHKADVTKKFGDPTKVVEGGDGKQILAYLGPQVIKGTSQAQFKIDPKTQLVERIDVFPGPVIEKEAIENTYGPACQPNQPASTQACYNKKVTDDFRTYFQYVKLGLAIFFNDDGKTVNSFIFTPQKVKDTAAAKGP